MFDLSPAMALDKLTLRSAPPLAKGIMLGWERELLGIYVSSHPSDIFHERVSTFVTACSDAQNKIDGEVVRVCGVVMEAKKILTKKKQEPMAFVRLEDRSGQTEIVVFPKLYNLVQESLMPGQSVVITGKGSEPWMCLKNGKKIPWSDKEIVRELLK